MTTIGPPGDGQSDPGARAVLVRSRAPPELPALECVDVRPGPVAVFDGDRVRLSLSVATGARRRRVGWHDFAELEAALTRCLPPGASAAVRFGDRSACRAALGPARVAAVERRLVSTARRERVALVTWTGARPHADDYRTYDAVVGPAARSD